MTAPIPDLLSFDQLARASGFSKDALRKVAMKHGLVIQCGRVSRIKSNEVEELFEKCRVGKKAHASLNDDAKAAQASGSSKTPAVSSAQPALDAAKQLKKRSRATSPTKPSQVAHLQQKNS